MPIPVPMDMPKVEKPQVVIDGRADEQSWSEAIEVSGFTAYRPKPGVGAKKETTVRVMSTDRALYVHFRAQDDATEDLRYGYGRRDSRRSDDYVGLMLDPLGTGERGALFIVNPLGVQMDGTLVRGRDSELVPWRSGWSSWDTRWTSAAIRTDEGFEVELEIPWSSIRHPQSVDSVRAIFFRRSAAISEMSSWPAIDPTVQGVLVQAQDMGGPGQIPKSSGLSVRPEVTTTRTDAGVPEDRLGLYGVAPGLTLQYAPSSSLQLLATVNPDFSQVESDEAKIDVNQRYSLRYEEKRPFFLEGQEWFSHPLRDLVYTRTMVTPLYGLRATSETGGLTMAAMHVWDRTPPPSVSEGGGWSDDELEGRESLATIARLRWSMGRDSMVGAIVSDRTIMNTDLRHHLVGVDGRVAVTDALNLEGALLGSSTRGEDQDGSFAPAGVFRNRVNTRHIESMVEVSYISSDFRSENGFQPYANWVSVENDTEFFIFPTWSAVPRVFLTPGNGEAVWTESADLRKYAYTPGIGFWTRSGALFVFDADVEGEEFADQWFDTVSGSVMGGASWTRWLRTWVRAEVGEGILYDEDNPSVGLKRKLKFDLSLQPFSAVRIAPQIGWERFTQGGTEVYDGAVLRVKLELYATPTVWNRWIYDKSTFDNSQSIEALIAWEHAPGQAIYLGGRTAVTKGTDDEPSDTEGKREWAAFAKASWVFGS